MTTDLELFNAHQEDVRRRADSLSRAIFLLAGGTLTLSISISISISIFTSDKTPEFSNTLSTPFCVAEHRRYERPRGSEIQINRLLDNLISLVI